MEKYDSEWVANNAIYDQKGPGPNNPSATYEVSYSEQVQQISTNSQWLGMKENRAWWAQQPACRGIWAQPGAVTIILRLQPNPCLRSAPRGRGLGQKVELKQDRIYVKAVLCFFAIKMYSKLLFRPHPRQWHMPYQQPKTTRNLKN